MADTKPAIPEVKHNGKTIRLKYQTQVTKLALKTEAELEYLDALREYTASLRKLSKTTAARRFKKFLGTSQVPLTAADPSSKPAQEIPLESRIVYFAFEALLSDTELMAKEFHELNEGILTKVSDSIKELTMQKVVLAKKTNDYSLKHQQELAQQYDELEKVFKTKKIKIIYEKAVKDVDVAKKKYDEALKKPKSGLKSLKTMVTGKDSASIVQKLKTKVKNKISAANETRNEYLLALIALNTAQGCYDNNDLPRIMERLDGLFYDNTKELLLKFVEFEKGTTEKINVKSEHMKEQIEKINREIDVKEFLNDFPQAFKPNTPLQFESATVDTVSEIVVDDVTRISLGKILGQLFSKDEALAAQQVIKDNELIGANALITQYVQNPDLGNPTQSREMIVEIQNQQDEIYSQREVLKSQIEALIALNISPIMEVKKDTNGVIAENHDAVGEDQITVKAGDEVKILDQKEGLIRVQTTAGLCGWIPAQKVTISVPFALSGPPPKTVIAEFEFIATEEGELSFKVGDEIECLDGVAADEEWWEGKLVSTGATGTFPVRFTKGWEAVAAGWGGLARQQSVRNIAPAQNKLTQSTPQLSNLQRQTSNVTTTPAKSEGFSAKALYAYEASCPGELTIEAGEIIMNVNMETGSDQWWEGSGLNGRGQFPMSYVEKIDLSKTGIKSTKLGRVKAVYDYQSTNQGDLSFKVGDIINVIQSDDSDWWDGLMGQKVGSFPAAYVEKIIE